MTSPKLTGLRYLQSTAPDLTVPTQFFTEVAELDAAVFDDRADSVFRARTGRISGSEMEAPYATFRSADEACAFLRAHIAADAQVVGVIHQVDPGYFEAIVIGSVLVGFDGSLYIELQTFEGSAVADLHAGMGPRPRDWAVDAVVRVAPGGVLTGIPARHLALVDDLDALVEIGRRVHADHPGSDCVIRFNLYTADLLVLDDFRLVDSFQGSAS